MDVSYDHLKVFYSVAKQGSFTKAAQDLHTSQPAVTRSIRVLEEETGCSLFHRTKRSVTLTEEGKILYQYANLGFNQLDLGVKALMEFRNPDVGTLRIGANEIALEGFLFDIIDLYHERYPNVTIHLSNISYADSIRQLNEGDVDFCFVTCEAGEHQAIHAVEMLNFRDVPVAGTRYADLAGRPVSLTDLKTVPLVNMSAGHSIREFCRKIFAEYGEEMTVDMVTNAYAYMLPMIEHNLGYGFIPDFMVREPIAEGKIFELNLLEKFPARQACMLYNPVYIQEEGNLKAFRSLSLEYRKKLRALP